MDTSYISSLSNLSIDYYYGGYSHLGRSWKDYDVICPFCKIYYIIEGECEIKIKGTPYMGKRGRMFFLPSQVKHSFYHINDNFITKYWIHFDIKSNEGNLLKHLNLPFYIDVTEDSGIVRNFLDIFQYSKDNSLSSILRLKAAILSLFSDYIEASGLIPKAFYPENNSDFNGIIAYINNNLEKKITLEDLAARMHMHPNYFIRLFKSKMGTTPLNYINTLKTERAKSLLENTMLPVSEVMLQVGCEDLSSFSNFFKHYTGYNPQSFRKSFGLKP